jgi:WD40 repeat protein/tetratricopeptide (TPR) repeat protein
LLHAGLAYQVRNQGLAGRTDWQIVSVRPGYQPAANLLQALPPVHAGVDFLLARWHEKLEAWDDALAALASRRPLPARPPAASPEWLEKLRLSLSQVASTGQPLLLIIDQFEELFTLCYDEGQRAAAARALAEFAQQHADHFRLVVAVRSDQVGYAVGLPTWDRLALKFFQTKTPGPDQIRAIIKQPAAEHGYAFEGDGEGATGQERRASLLQRILDDALLAGASPEAESKKDGDKGEAQASPTPLPLLEFALERLWLKAIDRGSSTFSHEDYKAIGFLAGAVTRHADDVYQEMPRVLRPKLDQADPRHEVDPQLVARRVLTGLVKLLGPKYTRRSRRRDELETATGYPAVARLVIDHLIAERLLTVRGDPGALDAAHLDLAHEVLIKEWGALNTWIKEDPFGRTREGFENDASRWQREPKYRPHPETARTYLAWVVTAGPSLTETQKQFVNGLRRFVARRRLVTRGVSAAIALLAVGASIAAGVAEWQRREANEARHDAVNKKAELEAANITLGNTLFRRLVGSGSQHLKEGNPALALVPFLQAEAQPHVPQADRDLNSRRLAAVRAELPRLRHVWPAAKAVNHAAYAPDGSKVVVVGDEPVAWVYDTFTGAELAALPHRGPLRHAAWNRDGTRLATVGRDGPAVQHAAKQLAGDEPGAARVWDAVTWKPIGEPLTNPVIGERIEFGANGADVIVTFRHKLHPPGEQITWNPTTGKVIKKGPAYATSPGQSGVVAPHGLYRAEAFEGGLVMVLPTTAGRESWARNDSAPISRIRMGAEERITGLEFSPDGLWLAVGGDSGTVRVFMVTTGSPVTPVLPHPDAIKDCTFSPDGRHLLTVCDDEAVRVWDVSSSPPGGAGWASAPGEDWGLGALSADGKLVAVTEESNYRVVVQDAETHRPIADLRHPGKVSFLRFSPDGSHLVTAASEPWGLDGNFGFGSCVILWNASTWQPSGLPLELAGEVRQVRFEDDGRCLLLTSDGHRDYTGGIFGAARVWDLTARTPVTPPLEHTPVQHAAPGKDPTGYGLVLKLMSGTPPIQHVTFSKDGRLVAIGGEERTALVYDVATGKPVGPPLSHPQTVNWVEFSPDGQVLATGGEDHEVRFWDYRAGREVRPALHHSYPVLHLAFNPAGTRLVVAQGRGGARVWDPNTGRPVGVPFGRDFSWVGFRRDGRELLAVTPGGEFQFWDAETAEPVSPPIGEPSGPARLFFTPEAVLSVSAHHARLHRLDRVLSWPRDDLQAVAELTAGQGVDETGGLTRLTTKEQQTRLAALKPRLPAWFDPPDQAADWHARRAALALGVGTSSAIVGMKDWKEREAHHWAAVFHFTRLIDGSRSPPAEWFLRRGYSRVQLREYAGARSDFERAAATPAPGSAAALYNLGLMCAVAGERAAAADAFARCLESGTVGDALPAGVALLRAGRAAEAERAITTAITRKSYGYVRENAYLFRGQARVLLGRFREALEDLDLAVPTPDPNAPPTALENQPELWFWRAAAHAGLLQRAQAFTALSRSNDCRMKFPHAPLSSELFHTPEDWVRRTIRPEPEKKSPADWFGATAKGYHDRTWNTDLALDQLNRAVSQNPGFWRAYLYRGDVLAATRPKDALADYGRALELVRREPPSPVTDSHGKVADPQIKAAIYIHSQRLDILRDLNNTADALAETDALLAATDRLPDKSDLSFRFGLDLNRVRYTRGSLLESLGRREEAVEAYAKLLAGLDEREVLLRCDGLYRRMTVLQHLRRWEETAGAARELLALIPKGRLVYQSSHAEKVRVSAALDAQAKDAAAALLEALMAQDQWRQAADQADELIRTDPSAQAFRRRGLIRARRGEFEKALADLTVAVDKSQGWWPDRLLRGLTLERLGRTDEALAEYDKAAAGTYVPWQLRLQRAVLLMKLGRHKAALNALGTAEGLARLGWRDASDPRFYLVRGRCHLATGATKSAASDFAEAARIRPESWVSWWYLGLAQAESGLAAEAIESLVRALGWVVMTPGWEAVARAALDGGFAFQYLLDGHCPAKPYRARVRGELFALAGESGLAEGEFSRQLQLSPADWIALWDRSDVRATRQGRFADLNEAVRLAPPGVWEPRAARGRLYFAIQQYKDAEWDLSEVLKAAPNTVQCRLERGEANLRLRRYSQAVDDFTLALKTRPDTSGDYELHLAEAYAGLKDWPAVVKAVTSWDRKPRESIDLAFHQSSVGEMIAPALLRAGDTKGYGDLTRKLSALVKDPQADDYVVATVAWACALAPTADSDMKSLVERTSRNADKTPSSAAVILGAAAVLVRTDRGEEALRRLDAILNPSKSLYFGKAARAEALALRAVALGQVGQLADSWTALQEAGQLLSAAEGEPLPSVSWYEREAVRLLLEEAMSLLCDPSQW